jgi:hypothetical protein
LFGRLFGHFFVSVTITALGTASLLLHSSLRRRDKSVLGKYELNFLFRSRTALGKVFLARGLALI